MGFYIPEYEVDLKQHLNLSESAWLTIYDDIKNFYMTEQAVSFSGFLNRVFFNYYQSADATISQRFINKSEELEHLFSFESFLSTDKKTTDLFVSSILNAYEKQLIEKSISNPKGEGKKFRINKQNVEILRDSADSIYYQDSIGLYLKAIFEEYVKKPTHIREQIFFKQTIDQINSAIINQKKIKIAILQKTSVDEKKLYTRKFYLTPYKIVQDRAKMFNYVISYAEEILKDGSIGTKTVSSFRISRIDKISIMMSMSGFISKDAKNALEKALIAKEPQFMVGDIQNIKIKFTKKGLENFNRHIYMRPRLFDKIADDIYIFHCTEVQALNYFFKFGNEAIILEPASLREKITTRYLSAYNAYIEQ